MCETICINIAIFYFTNGPAFYFLISFAIYIALYTTNLFIYIQHYLPEHLVPEPCRTASGMHSH